jgi:hypothetical protein
MMNPAELEVLTALDRAVMSKEMTPKFDALAAEVARKLRDHPADTMAWEVIPLDTYTARLPESIRSSWVFILRANATTGAERHPNSIQRMMSYRGSGDFQTRPGRDWISHELVSDAKAPLAQRWISIPTNVWHQGVVANEEWVVVSFHTVEADELIEERPVSGTTDAFRQKKYVVER